MKSIKKSVKSINQINSFCNSNQTIQMYREIDSDRSWRSKSYCHHYKHGDSYQSNAGTDLYIAANRYLIDYCGMQQYDCTKYKHYEIDGFKVSINQKITLSGVYIEVYHYGSTEIMPYFSSYKIRSNETYDQFDPIKYFENNILPKYLYASGLFRNIQLCYGCSKKDAISWYKKMNTKERVYVVDTDKAWRQLFKRKLNILIENYFTDSELKTLFKVTSRCNVRTKMFKAPSIWELSEQYGCEYDTEEYIEEFIHDQLSDYPKNSILV